VLESANLGQKLAQSPALDVVAVRFGDTAKEVERVGVRQVEGQGAEHVPFGLDNLFDTITAIGHVKEVRDGGANDLLVLCRDEKSGETDKLKLDERNYTLG